MDSDYLHKLTKTELVNLIANLEFLIVSIKTQLLESAAREDEYEDTIKMLLRHELKNLNQPEMNMKEFLNSDLLPTEINPFNREQLISDIRDFMEVMSQRELTIRNRTA